MMTEIKNADLFMKNILVATDLSIRSERAVRRAFAIAESCSCEVTVTCVIDDELPTGVAKTLAADARQELEALCTSITEKSVDIRVVIGDPVQDIVSLSEKLDVDLIILGVHKKRAFWDMFSGTTMERIVRATNRAVLLSSEVVANGYKNVLCGIDLSPACEAAANISMTVAPEAKLYGFHAMHVPYIGLFGPDKSAKTLEPFIETANKRLHDWWQNADLPTGLEKPEPMPMSVTESLAIKLKEIKPDLIAIGAHGRSLVSPTLLGSFTEMLIRTPPCDLLLVRR